MKGTHSGNVVNEAGEVRRVQNVEEHLYDIQRHFNSLLWNIHVRKPFLYVSPFETVSSQKGICLVHLSIQRRGKVVTQQIFAAQKSE